MLAVSALVVLATARVPEGIVGDAALQLRALQQFAAGRSPSLNHVVMPSLGDLTRDGAEWLTWWPPGPQILAYPWVALGAPLGTAARIVAALAMIIGSLGWSAWFRRFDLPTHLRWGAAAALPLLHSANATLFVFTQDVLNFAVAPWLLTMADALAHRDDRAGVAPLWFLAGLALGLTYVIKYSLVFVAVGVLAFFGMQILRRRQRAWPVVALAAGCALPIVTLTALNARMNGVMNNAAQTAGFFPHWQSLLALIASPILAVADADSLWRYLLLHPSHPVTNDPLATIYVGVVPGLVLWWLVARAVRDSRATAARLALVVFGVTMLALLGTWTFSAAADYEARHVAPASLAILPVAYLGAVRAWQQGGWARRLLPAAVGLTFVAVPLLYGAVAVAGKLTRVPSTYTLGPSHLYNPLLASTDLAPVERAIIGRFGRQTDVWFSADAVTALDLPGRVWTETNLDFVTAQKLATLQFRTSAPVRVTVLVPPKFEAEGKLAVIREGFRGARAWTRATVAGSNYDIWTTVVEPIP